MDSVICRSPKPATMPLSAVVRWARKLVSAGMASGAVVIMRDILRQDSFFGAGNCKKADFSGLELVCAASKSADFPQPDRQGAHAPPDRPARSEKRRRRRDRPVIAAF